MTLRLDADYKFGFVHIPKTGGTSIHKWIEKILAQRHPEPVAQKLPFHATLPALRMPDDYVSVSVVRNPWSRMVSMYEFDRYCRSQPDMLPYLQGADPNMEFKDWIKYERISKYRWVYPQDTECREIKMWFTPTTPQTVWLPWEPDVLIRYENLGAGFEILHELMKCDDILIGHEYNTRHAPYQEYYDDESIRLVGKYFATDVERWNYTFD